MRLTALRADGASSWRGGTLIRPAIITIAICLLVTAFSQPALYGEEPGAAAGTVLLQFPAPGSSPSGLTWDGSHLWVADDGTDTIYRLDPADGRVISSFKSPGEHPRGLAFDGTHLWCSDNTTQSLQKLAPADGTVLATQSAPLPQVQGRQPEVGGMAWDGTYLYSGTVAGWSSKMNQLNPKDGSVKRSYFTKGYPRGIATDGEYIWNTTDNDGKRLGIVYQYNLSDGLFVSQFDTPGFHPTGLAFDGECLWCVDRETRTIYRLTAR